MQSSFEPKGVPVTTFDRTVVFGNTASGKTWLSKRLGAALSVSTIELDRIRYVNGDFRQKARVAAAISETLEQSKNDTWIIEGVYGWLIAPVLDRATCLIWIDLPWDDCRKNLIARETARGPGGNLEELEPWAREYWTRESSSSRFGHRALFDDFPGRKFHLTCTPAVSEFTQTISKA